MAAKKKTKKKATKKKATKKKAASRKASKSRESLIVSSKVKAFIKSQSCLTAGDFLTALNEQVYDLVATATTRAQGNKRSTVKPNDL